MKKFVDGEILDLSVKQNKNSIKENSGKNIQQFYLELINAQSYHSSNNFMENRDIIFDKIVKAKDNNEIVKIESKKFKDKNKILNAKNALNYAQNDDIERLKVLIENGLNVNLKDNYGWSLLMLASFANSKNVVKYLLGKNAKRGFRDDHGNTAIYLASKKGNFEIVKMLTKLEKYEESKKVYEREFNEDSTISDKSNRVQNLNLYSNEYTPEIDIFSEENIDVLSFSSSVSAQSNINSVGQNVVNSCSEKVQSIPLPDNLDNSFQNNINNTLHSTLTSSTTSSNYCKDCDIHFSCSKSDHKSCISHLFKTSSEKHENKFSIPRDNIGFQMLLNQGWDDSQGLGPSGSGIKYPVKVKQRLNRIGLGHVKEKKMNNKEIKEVKTLNIKELKNNLNKEKLVEIAYRKMLNEPDFDDNVVCID